MAPQITETDLAILQNKGIKSIICNRPDGEGADQPTFQELSQTAQKMGIAMRYNPISCGLVHDQDVLDFSDALNTLPKHVVAYCRTGIRSATPWSLAQANDMPLADAAGWVDAGQATLRHKTIENIWSLGDGLIPPNAKTVAAARKQAPVAADNIVANIRGREPVSQYHGSGSCLLTVERGKIALAEFGYGGILQPSFPRWLIDATKPSRLAWLLKEKTLPSVYLKAMLNGCEWLATPEKIWTR